MRTSLKRRLKACALWEPLKAFLSSLGSDVMINDVADYVAFKRARNFACVFVRSNAIILSVRLDPASVNLETGFTRDVTNIGHLGTGNLEIRVVTESDFNRAKPLLMRSYAEN
jgi:predicted transport protein